jgi:polyphenol oxidase
VSTVRSWALPAGRAVVRSSVAVDGDFCVDAGPDDLARRRSELHPAPWTWLRQTHGSEVVTVTRPGRHAGRRADAAVTVTAGCPLAVTTADCAALVLVATSGVGVVHAGWRGAGAGIVERTAEALSAAGGGAPVASWLAPCISPSAYAFGPEPLAELVARYGPTVAGRTAAGDPALDLRAVVRAACEAVGWPPPAEPACTSHPGFFSHRTRGDTGRQATVAWLEGP